MPRFIYKARNKQGREIQATEEAASEDELITQLQNKELLVISVASDEPLEKAKEESLLRPRLHGRAKVDDLIIFSRQLGTLLEAGVTLLKSLDVLSRQIESRALVQAVQEIRQDVAEGSTFRDALLKHPKIFSEFWVHMVETGESSGALPLTLKQLADYLEASAQIERKVTSAMIYPAVLVIIAIAALTVFTIWIIPIFARVFKTLDVELPLLTQWVLALSKMMQRYFIFLLAALTGGGYLLYRYIQTEAGRWQLDRLKFKIPILASLVQRISIERFASGLGILVESGVPILFGLDIISKAAGNKLVEKAIIDVRESVRQGKGMAQPLEKSGLFTPMVVQMVSVGEEIGELGKMLKHISEFYKERISATIERGTTLIEPVMLIIMGVVVGVLVVSMFLPIFQIAVIAPGQ